MNYLIRESRLIVFVMTLSVLTGCIASFDRGKVPGTTLTEPTAEDQNKPTLFYGIYTWGGGISKKEELLEELHKSKYFNKITNENFAEADIELYATLRVFPNPNFPLEDMGYLSGMTLGMIPLWSTEQYEVKARVKNKKGREKEYVVKDSVTYVAWWPMLLLFPFTYDTDKDVQSNMYRNIISQMYEDGFMGEI